MSTRILLTADLHIGVTSSRVRQLSTGREFSAAEAWYRIVELARNERVAAVLLSGDIVDENNKFFEAIGPLQRGIERLAESGIRTIAVSGNHDHDVLRRLASELAPEAFCLLGPDGDWERVAVEDGGESVLNVDGVSFPTAVVRNSPLESYTMDREPSVPTIGIVHGDIHDKTSPYRPLDLSRLQRFDIDGWLLGHIHARNLVEQQGSPWVLYPGSPQALDPGEEGLHGPWIAEVEGSTLLSPVQRPLSSTLYAAVDIDLTEVKDRESLEGSITSQIRDHARQIIPDAGDALRVAVLRCGIHGTTTFADEVGRVAEQLRRDLELDIRGVAVVVDAYTVDVVPPIDLEQYARSNSAPGAVARLLTELDELEPTDGVRRLMDDVMGELKRVDSQRDFADLDPPAITEEVAKNYLRRQAQALLAELVKDEL